MKPSKSKQMNTPYNLSSHPRHRQALGQIVANWSIVEYQLSSLYAYLLRAPPWHGRAAFYAVVNANARIDMMRALVDRLLMLEEQDRGDLAAMLDDARILAGKRNAHVHGLWMKRKGRPCLITSLDYPLAKAQKKHIPIVELITLAKEIKAFADRLSDFTKTFSEKYPLKIVPEEIERTLRHKLERRS